MEVQPHPHPAHWALKEELKTTSSAAVLTGATTGIDDELVLILVPDTLCASQLTRHVTHLQDSKAAKCKQGFQITR